MLIHPRPGFAAKDRTHTLTEKYGASIIEPDVEEMLRVLKPGGRIVYSTCSLEREENLGLLETWLTEHPELELLATREALPFRDATDGAFAASIQRRG